MTSFILSLLTIHSLLAISLALPYALAPSSSEIRRRDDLNLANDLSNQSGQNLGLSGNLQLQSPSSEIVSSGPTGLSAELSSLRFQPPENASPGISAPNTEGTTGNIVLLYDVSPAASGITQLPALGGNKQPWSSTDVSSTSPEPTFNSGATSPGYSNALSEESPISPGSSLPNLSSGVSSNQTPPVGNARDAFYVKGDELPDVPFDIGETYAGLLPLSDMPTENRKLYFWYVKATDPNSHDLTLWLNGGPGCSSLFGLVQEHGPFLFPEGSRQGVPNPKSWHHLTHMLYVEHPLGVGFTQGTPDRSDEIGISQEFIGFLRNFYKTFPELQGKRLHFAGESYASQYLIYLANQIAALPDAPMFNAGNMLIINGLVDTNIFWQSELATWPTVEANRDLFQLPEENMSFIQGRSKECGYDKYLQKYLVYPAVKIGDWKGMNCGLWDQVNTMARKVNGCYSFYNIGQKCPENNVDVLANNRLDFTNYFSRADVQNAIHAPRQAWSECTNDQSSVFLGGADKSPGVDDGPLQDLLTRGKRLIWTASDRDFVVMTKGTRLLLNNLFWDGARGFREEPQTPFFVNGVQTGIWHKERDLTYVEIKAAGHQLPKYDPDSSYKLLQYMLEQIDTL